MKLLTKLLGDPSAKHVNKAKRIVQQINSCESQIKSLSDAKLKQQTRAFKERLSGGESLDRLLPEAFATVREAARRSIGQRHYDVQLVGGIVLHRGDIAEMRTGEGKTLVATAPVYLNALEGKGVHVVTVNDYLARRDAGWMGKIYHALGLSTGVIIHDQALLYDPAYTNEQADDERLQHLKPVSRREAYAADITYGTNNEFGFDYLRDNMVRDVREMVQRPLNYAIVDEVDSILIDEARTPLIISAPAEESTDKYQQFAALAKGLKLSAHYTVDEKMRAVSLNDEGINALEKALGIDNIYEAGGIEEIHHIEQSLKAEALFKRDRDYVVKEGEIIIVDEFTGRLMHGRRYSEGLHQAIEAKEKVAIRQESLTLATVSFQNYFRLYGKLAGMTGTAATEAEEFHKIYKLDVVIVPTHQPMVRQDHADRIYKTHAGKFAAVVKDVQECHKKGQPVLLGTVSIEKNELLSRLLKQAGVPHQILNAKNNEKEAAIVSQAGQKGAVTLATNIAGRGTDIMLGEGVTKLGGLHVIGTERHESRRIDNQLRGRSGRQGDPGSSRFYVSLEDDLMRIFGGERVAGLMSSLGMDEDTPLENKMISKSLESAQKKVEGHNFDIRKQVVEYDDVMNKHREVIYARRRKALEHANLRPEVEEMLEREFVNISTVHTDARTGIMDTEKVLEAAASVMPLEEATADKIKKADPRDVVDILKQYAAKLYDEREKQFGEEGMRILERLMYLQILDRLWIEHLEAMDGLREGIGLRAIGQRDPLVEYKSEGFRLFKRLVALMESEIAGTVFKASIEKQEIPAEEVETVVTKASKQAATNLEEEGLRDSVKSGKIGRNDPCPCGSTKKYKKCGMLNTAEHQTNMNNLAASA
ncbi:MAG TPA: preprotein translocase subunit SecA [Candidatus Dormibacteraeota bacterium]|nr:preprotein translocase subunit SecA [Candidatus Dormibacteraeota bacterium]